MNFNPVLAGMMPVRGAATLPPGDSRLPPATAGGETACAGGGFARALTDAAAPGRPTGGAAPDGNGRPADGSRAGDERAAGAAAAPATPAEKAEASDPAKPSPHAPAAAAPAKASAAKAGHAAGASTPAQKARVIAAGGAAATAPAADTAPSEGTPSADPTPAPTAEASPAGAAADAAALLAELQARHTASAATSTSGDAATDPADPADARAQRLPSRRLAAAAAATARPAAAAPASAATTARNAPTVEAAPVAAGPVPLAEPVAPNLPAGALPPLVGAATALQPGTGSAPVAEARLAAAPGSAEFASQLGSQLTTFVRDGVQHARLHLNPAELGPVTVQIRIEGQAAQVHMAAEHGLTRQALEQSMPLLAGSLREAGLTLSGGGVFEQPRQGRDDAPPARAAGSPGQEPADEPVPHHAVTATRHRGVVDLVA